MDRRNNLKDTCKFPGCTLRLVHRAMDCIDLRVASVVLQGKFNIILNKFTYEFNYFL